MSRLRQLDDEFQSGVLWTRPRVRVTAFVLLGIVVVAVGSGFAWLMLGAALFIPGDHPSIYFGLPLVAVGIVAWLVAKRFRWLAVAFGASGALTLLFFAWLFWELGQGMADFN